MYGTLAIRRPHVRPVIGEIRTRERGAQRPQFFTPPCPLPCALQVVSNPAGFDGRANYGMYSSIISQTQNNFFGPCTPVNQNDWTTAWNNGRNQWVASALNSFSSSFSGQTANAQTGLFLIFAASAGMMGALVHIALSVLSLQMVRSVKIVFSQASAVATAANPLTMVRDWTSGL